MTFKLTFGPGLDGTGRLDYRELAQLTEEQRIIAWTRRQEALFLKQVGMLTVNLGTPFPLAVMTCVGIAMLGAYKYGDPGNNSNRHFQLVVRDIEPKLESTHCIAPGGRSQRLSDSLYYGFRNALIHGFYGRWVFVTHDPTEVETFRYSKDQQILGLNVYWFWARFHVIFQDYTNCLQASDPKLVTQFNKTFLRHYKPWLDEV